MLLQPSGPPGSVHRHGLCPEMTEFGNERKEIMPSNRIKSRQGCAARYVHGRRATQSALRIPFAG